MIGTCYKCKDYTEVSIKNRQRNGSLLCICRPCRNVYQAEWKEQRARQQPVIRAYDYLSDPEDWTRISKEKMNNLSRRTI